jgi:capsular exopolysaccharide synthesis family protein
VVNEIDYPVSYYTYGTYLVDEKYGNNPIEVSFLVKDPAMYDRPIDIDILDENRFALNIEPGGEKKTYNFGDEVITDRINLLVEKTRHLAPSLYGRYYITINSDASLINYFQSNLKVQPENFNAKTIQIGLQDFNRTKARDFVTAVDTLYLQYTTQKKNQAIEQKIAFLDKQIEEKEEILEGFEDYFENFTIENRTTSVESDLTNSIKVINALDSQRFRLQLRFNNVQVLQKQLEKEDARMLNPYLVQQMPEFIVAALEEYDEKVQQLEARRAFYNEESAVISRLKDEVQIAKSSLKTLIDEHVRTYEEELDRVKRRISMMERNFVELPAMGSEYEKNMRLYSLEENFLLQLRQSKMELEITRAGTVTESVILSPASFPLDPVKPQKLIIFGIAFVAALVLSVVLVLVRYLLHNKVSSLKELEKLTYVPIVGSIPEYQKEKLQSTRLVVDSTSKSAVSEALRTLRTNLEFLRPTEDTRMISVSSTIGGEGKTFAAVNLAAIIASTRRKVCVVDLDMRKPKVNQAFGKPDNSVGVSTLLIGKSNLKECVQETSVDSLYFIGSGPTPPNPSELILTKEFDTFLSNLKDEFDLIILDTPPVGLVTDGVLAMKRSDVQLYIMKSDYSKRSFIKTIENVQEINGFNHMGIILNSIPLSKNNFAYGSYGDFGHYGYGYGYYEEPHPRKGLFRLRS